VEDELGAEPRIEATLTGFACSGTQTIARTPKSREAKAIDCRGCRSRR
jgi:hypothetical protein